MTESSISPRRAAQQKRSREKVEKILATTLSLLTDRPADQVNTNLIAEKAGVSVGTLYQFFPNKEAIFHALFQRWLAVTLEVLDSVQAQLPEDASREDCVDVFLEALTEPTLNSKENWKLRWAMGTSPKLAELEAEHKGDVLRRIVALQQRFGDGPPPEFGQELMLLQNELILACLYSLSLCEASQNRDQMLSLCKKLVLLIFDFPRWSAL